MKKCTKCGLEKPKEDYYFVRTRSLYTSQCTMCLREAKKIYNKKWNKTETAKLLKKAYAQSEHGKSVRKRYRQTEEGRASRVRDWAKNGKRRWVKYKREGKIDARNAINNAVNAGRIKKQSCGVCGDPSTHAHHHDYSQPLEVIWLCVAHHTQVHVEAKCQNG